MRLRRLVHHPHSHRSQRQWDYQSGKAIRNLPATRSTHGEGTKAGQPVAGRDGDPISQPICRRASNDSRKVLSVRAKMLPLLRPKGDTYIQASTRLTQDCEDPMARAGLETVPGGSVDMIGISVLAGYPLLSMIRTPMYLMQARPQRTTRCNAASSSHWFTYAHATGIRKSRGRT